MLGMFRPAGYNEIKYYFECDSRRVCPLLSLRCAVPAAYHPATPPACGEPACAKSRIHCIYQSFSNWYLYQNLNFLLYGTYTTFYNKLLKKMCYQSVQNPLSSSSPSKKYKDQSTQKYNSVDFFCMGGKLRLTHWGMNIGWGCSRIGCWERHLGMTGMR